MIPENLTLKDIESEYLNKLIDKIEIDEVVIVRHNFPDAMFENIEDRFRNILAFRKSDGKFLWKIELPAGFHNSYTGMGFYEEHSPKVFRAYNCNGYYYVVDLKTGKISDWRDPSWPPGYKPRPW